MALKLAVGVSIPTIVPTTLFRDMLGHTAAMLVREQRNFYVACCAGNCAFSIFQYVFSK
jgi:hypothetical protein